MLTANQRKALAALLASKSRVDAARVCGLSTKTLQGYEKLPEFAEALEKAAGRRWPMPPTALPPGILKLWTPCRILCRTPPRRMLPALLLPASCLNMALSTPR